MKCNDMLGEIVYVPCRIIQIDTHITAGTTYILEPLTDIIECNRLFNDVEFEVDEETIQKLKSQTNKNLCSQELPCP